MLTRLTAEENARLAADTALGGRVDVLGTRIGALETRVDKLNDKVSSATATAIALGGNGFLPDMKFNLSGNIATFDGAQAIAMSLGYRINDNFAFTAAAGGGLNKGGKVGGRVGFIYGW